MNCSECGETMQWRCTNQETGVAKYKCPTCGNVQLGEDDWKEPVVVPRTPKHYYVRDGKYYVRKFIGRNHKVIYIGCYGNEETAKKVVEEMIKCDWNLDMIPTIYDKLNIHKVNRSWVCV